jgi:Tfp pilus assembly protein PilW
MTLIEMLIAVGLFSIVGTAMISMFVYCTKSFIALNNYCELSRVNREAVDRLSREVRQARGLTAFSTNSVTLLDGGGQSVTYAFNPQNKTLTRSSGGVSKVLLSDCTVLSFNVCQRNPIGGSYDIYPVATTVSTAKVINLSWKSSRTALNGLITSENVQTARIVIRKQ